MRPAVRTPLGGALLVAVMLTACAEVEGPPRARSLVMTAHLGAAAGTHPVGTVVGAPAVRVTDENGDPVLGISVVFSAVSGRGVVSPPEVITGLDGVAATTTWMFGTAAGDQTVVASMTNATHGLSVSFAGTATAGPTARVSLAARDFNLRPAQVAQLIVRPTDTYRNPTGGPVAATFVSSNAAIASVDAAGLLTAQSLGAVRVIATSGADADTAYVGIGLRPGGAALTTHDTPQAPWAVASGANGTVHAVSGGGSRLYTYSVATGLPLGFAELDGPGVDIALTPDQGRAVVVQPQLGTLRVVDLATHLVTRTVTGLGAPIRVALSPDGAFAFVGTTVGLRRVELATGTVTGVDFAGGSNGVEVDGARGVVYASTLAGQLLEISMSTLAVLRSVPLNGGLGQGVALTPDGRVYVANETFGLQVVDVQTFALLDTYGAYSGAYDVAVTQDGRHVYVSRSQAGVVAIVDAFTHLPVRTHGGAEFRRMSAAADGRSIAIARASGGFTVIR